MDGASADFLTTSYAATMDHVFSEQQQQQVGGPVTFTHRPRPQPDPQIVTTRLPMPTSPPPSRTPKIGRTVHSPEDWNPYRELIRELWIEKNLTEREVAATLAQEHGFYFTKRQFDRITKKWGLRKNVRTGEMMVIVKTQRARESKGRKTAVRIHGEELSRSKIARWEQRHKDKKTLLNVDSIAAPPLEYIEFSPRNPETQERSRYYFIYDDKAGIMDSPKLTRLNALLKEDFEANSDDVPPMDLDSSNGVFDTDRAFGARNATSLQENASMALASTAKNSSYRDGRNFQTVSGGFLISELSPFPNSAPRAPSKASRTFYGLPYKRAEEMKYRCQLMRLKQKSYRDDAPEYLATLMQLAEVFMMQRNIETAQKIYRHVSKTRERTLGFEHEDTLRAATAFAEATFELGKHSEAEPRINRLYDVAPRVLGPDHKVCIAVRSMKSEIAGKFGNNEERDRLAREVLQISLQTYGPRHATTIQAICLVAEGLPADEKETFCRIGLKIGEHGGDKMDEAVIGMARELGIALQEQARNNECEEFVRYALNRSQKLYGPHHRASLPHEVDVNYALVSLRKFEAAAQLSRQTLLRMRKFEGFAIYETLYAMTVTALVLEGLNRYSEAEQWFIRVINELEKLCGKFNLDLMFIVAALAAFYERQNRFDDAIALFAQKHREFEEAGIENTASRRTLGYLAITLYEAKHFEEAAVHYWKLIDMETRHVGETHTDVLALYRRLGKCYANLQQWDEQVNVYRDKHEQLQRSAIENKYTLKIWKYLGMSLRSAQLFEESEKCFASLIVRKEAVLGVAHKTVMATYELLGNSYHDNGRYDEEIALYQVKLDQLRDLGFEKETVSIWGRLGVALVSACRFEDAEECLKTLIQRHEEVLGPLHHTIIQSSEALGDCYLAAERYEDMVALYQQKYDQLFLADIVETHEYLRLHFLLAWSLLKAKNHSEAEKKFLSLIENTEGLFGPAHKSTLELYEWLTKCYNEESRYKEILLFSCTKIELLFSVDVDGDDLCNFISPVALRLYRAGLSKSAAPFFELIIECLEPLHGPEHLPLLEAKVHMGWCCENRRRYGKALAAYETAQKGLVSLREAGEKTNEGFLEQLAEVVPKMSELVANGEGVGTEDEDEDSDEDDADEDEDDDEDDADEDEDDDEDDEDDKHDEDEDMEDAQDEVDQDLEGVHLDDQNEFEIAWEDYMDTSVLEDFVTEENWIF